jgi:hypothetical protein
MIVTTVCKTWIVTQVITSIWMEVFIIYPDFFLSHSSSPLITKTFLNLPKSSLAAEEKINKLFLYFAANHVWSVSQYRKLVFCKDTVYQRNILIPVFGCWLVVITRIDKQINFGIIGLFCDQSFQFLNHLCPYLFFLTNEDRSIFHRSSMN